MQATTQSYAPVDIYLLTHTHTHTHTHTYPHTRGTQTHTHKHTPVEHIERIGRQIGR